MVSLSIIVPTHERPSLWRTLESCAAQIRVEDQVIVVGDGAQPEAKRICGDFPFVQYFEGPKTRCYGNRQRQAAMLRATGTHLLFLDDDDVYVPRALVVVREAIRVWPRRPTLFQFIDKHGAVLWRDPVVRMGNVSGGQILFPNVPELLGTWGDRYEGDYDFIRSTVDLWPGRDEAVVWRPNILVDSRPVRAGSSPSPRGPGEGPTPSANGAVRPAFGLQAALSGSGGKP